MMATVEIYSLAATSKGNHQEPYPCRTMAASIDDREFCCLCCRGAAWRNAAPTLNSVIL